MNKLIIRHGERVTEHPIDDHPLVVGRDPQCDLFFADKKLSRRHARFERDGDGIRLVDLGSRNGCWVNEESAAVLVARRWTLLPVQELKDDVEALRRGFVESLAEDRPYSDLATIARNFNELVQQRDPDTSGSGSATFEPMLDPTLVPEEHEQADH